MARLITGINGPIVGRVGTIIGSSWKGIPHIKGPYKKRTKRVSKMELANREKFAMAQAWLRPLLGFVRVGFKGYSERSEGFGAAKSWLLKNCFEREGDKMKINPALMKVSSGDLPLANDITVEKIAPDRIRFTWDPASTSEAHPRDQVMMLAYNVKKESGIFTTTGQFRSEGMDELPIETKKGITYHLYLAFSAADRSRQSDSVYLGELKT